ncbi:hypothetical protein [Pseudothermotoga thermarum]|uniref:Uncharacterized protein n=1 Tax=Pseudothermotoga thermarum DSM 5069 TaxID=688269 RepID=F7YTN7_9THEM|nr:hypothetical protein [Pseudothermotoga thermarum]AEH51259.1 hypothetical protein Theth_1187 [Pseudothermotoga thermarum DSM 5069]
MKNFLHALRSIGLISIAVILLIALPVIIIVTTYIFGIFVVCLAVFFIVKGILGLKELKQRK